MQLLLELRSHASLTRWVRRVRVCSRFAWARIAVKTLFFEEAYGVGVSVVCLLTNISAIEMGLKDRAMLSGIFGLTLSLLPRTGFRGVEISTIGRHARTFDPFLARALVLLVFAVGPAAFLARMFLVVTAATVVDGAERLARVVVGILLGLFA